MRHYLDHAATSPLRPAARAAMDAAWPLANPSSLHTSGRRARGVLEDAREQLADALGAHPTEVVFTSGGSEADNLAVLGGRVASGRPGVAVGSTEHAAVLGVRGLIDDVAVLDVDAAGRVTDQALAALDERVGVVSVMAVNNETGVLAPLDAVVAAAHRVGALAHSDAVQAFGKIPFDFAVSGLDAASVSAHKIGGPVGVGALIRRRDARLSAVSAGGGQEAGLRSGTVPVALIAGFAAAASEAVASLDAEAARVGALRARLVEAVAALGGVQVVGEDTSPYLCAVIVDGARSDDLLVLLDAAGIDCSAGSACSAGVARPSSTLLAMGYSDEEASSLLRFSFGWTTTDADVDAALAALGAVIPRARAARRLS